MNKESIELIKKGFIKKAKLKELSEAEQEKRTIEESIRRHEIVERIKTFFKDLPFDTHFNVEITDNLVLDFYYNPLSRNVSNRPFYLHIYVRNIEFIDNRVTLLITFKKIGKYEETLCGISGDGVIKVINSYMDEKELLRLEKRLERLEKRLVRHYGDLGS